MIKLENIGKLNGVKIADWTCYMVEERKDHYTMLFESSTTTGVITQFRLFKEDQIKGLWTLKAKMDNRTMVVSQFQTNSFGDTQSLTKDEFQTFDAFCRTLTRTLHKFNDILRNGINVPTTYHTSSLATVTGRINSGGHSFGGFQIPKPPPVSHPQWYVSEEMESKPKMPTMWETFKEMIKWDKWINILFPMKTAIEQVIPKKKKITAKKAAY